MAKFLINNFAGGYNVLFDKRVLMPNAEGEPAESPDMSNVDLTSKGAIVTSAGFELVSSIVASGGVKLLLPYEKDSSTKYLILAHDDDYYYITPSNSTWQSIGDYGTAATSVGGVVYKGTSSTRRAILGNSDTSNTTKKWDGTTFASLGGTPPDGWIMESFQGRLFIAQGSTLYYCDIEDEDDWAGGGTISIDDDITGLKADQDVLQVHTSRGSFLVQFYYNDSFSLSAPLKKPYKNSSGCLAHKTIIPVYNDTYHLSRDGIQKFGADPQFIAQNIRVNSLSWKINPALFQNKLNMANIAASVAAFYQKKAYFSVPYGTDTFPSKTYVYNWDYDAWTVRNGFYPSGYAVFPDSNSRDQLYFSSALSPELYKFNNYFAYNGAGYSRYWTSKIFTYGDSLRLKRFNFIDLAGAMYTNTTFYVDIIVDGVTTTYKIDSSNLLQSSSGGYYGDDYLGDIFYGGDETSQFYRYGCRMYLPPGVAQGRELQIKIRNEAAGEPWSVDSILMDYEYESDIVIPEAALDEITS